MRQVIWRFMRCSTGPSWKGEITLAIYYLSIVNLKVPFIPHWVCAHTSTRSLTIFDMLRLMDKTVAIRQNMGYQNIYADLVQ